MTTLQEQIKQQSALDTRCEKCGEPANTQTTRDRHGARHDCVVALRARIAMLEEMRAADINAREILSQRVAALESAPRHSDVECDP